MFTRLWQHRYHGLLATLLAGLAAAVLVMLLPDRQQAFARFVVSPAVESATSPQTLMDDQRLVNRVLQRLDIESPNLIDPRPVDPVSAFQRNFGLRPTGTPGEFEISYMSRSPEQAAAGVKTWLAAANDVWQRDAASQGVIGRPDLANSAQAANAAGATSQALAREMQAAREGLEDARRQQQSLEAERSRLTEALASAQAGKARFDAEQSRAALALEQAQQAQQQAQAAEQRSADATETVQQANADLNQAEQTLSTAQQALAQANASAEQAATRLAQLTAEQTQATQAVSSARAALRTAQASKAEFGTSDSDRARNATLARAAQLDRQRATIETEIKQAADQRASLQRQLEQTPKTIVEVVTDKAAISQARGDASRNALISKTKAQLSELRVRFTDNHPDVRQQLAILAELESPGAQGNVVQAPTVGARPVVKPNPKLADLQRTLAKNQSQLTQLRERMATAQAQRERLLSQAKASEGDSPTERGNQAVLAQAQQQLTDTQKDEANVRAARLEAARLNTVALEAKRRAAETVVRAQADVETSRAALVQSEESMRASESERASSTVEGSSGQVSTARESDRAATQAQRQLIADELNRAESSLQANREALSAATTMARQKADLLATLESEVGELEASASTTSSPAGSKPRGIAQGGLTVVQPPQVVPASSNPDRTQWLLFGWLASLALGLIVALALAARRTAFGSIAELERVTGLRTLGGVPKFSSSRQTLGLWVSAMVFVALILLYGLIYLGFIALVESGSPLLSPDWGAWRETGFGMIQTVAARLGISEQWVAAILGNQ
ncbi:MAG: hypothetical protein AB8C46_19440 [Burkholderiaceae bacterium]